MTAAGLDLAMEPGKRAGVSLHVTSLPGPYGIGEIGQSALDFIDSLAAMKMSVWQILPTGPTAYGNSPYQPLSTFAGNEMLIDISDLISKGLLGQGDVGEITRLPYGEVDYGSLIPAKTRLLTLAASRFNDVCSDDLREAFDLFVARHNDAWLHDYALFRILKSQHDEKPWPEWSADYARRDPDALLRLESVSRPLIEQAKILQFLFFEQWARMRGHANGRGIRLFGDIPIYISLDSSDAWAHPELLRIDRDGRADAVAGVPPDYFSEDGQLWGNPLYDWEEHARNGYSWWIERMRKTLELCDIARIDHFRGFESYWAVPADAATARHGAWESGPGDAIFNAMNESLGNLPIVAEDLGLITPEVVALRDRHGIPGMTVLQFAVMDPGFELSDVPENCVCYTGTHDNDTTLGWFHGGPNERRSSDEIHATQERALRISNGSPESVHIDMVRAAFYTDARLAVVPLQDLLGLGTEARFNTPGTTDGNWRWRVPENRLSTEFCDTVAAYVEETKRGQIHNG